MEVVEQGVGGSVRMLAHVVGGIEPGMRIAQFRRASRQIVQQRMHAADLHIRILSGVPAAVEITVRVAALLQAKTDEVPHGV